MSIFDPQRIYRKSYRKSHKGQIIQQRAVETRSAISQEDLDKAVKLVRSLKLNTGREVPFTVSYLGHGAFVWDNVEIPSSSSPYNSIYVTLNNILSTVPASSELWTQLREYTYLAPYHIKDIHSRVGILLSLGIALMVIFFIDNPFYGLIISQMMLSFQLPFTVFLQVSLTSSEKVMGKYANSTWTKWLLYAIATIVSILNIMLLFS